MTDRRRAHMLAFAQQQREHWAEALAIPDRELLRMRDDEKLTYEQIHIRLGCSRARARQKVREARRREVTRSQMGK